MLIELPVNIYFGEDFLCSSHHDANKVMVNGYYLNIEEHVRLFDIEYVKKITNRSSVSAAFREFLSKEDFFGKACNFLFDPIFYSRRSGSIARLHPIIHYIILGDASGARTSQYFWTEWVRKRYPNDKRTALQIHLEGRNWVAPNPYFDPIWYLNKNADVYRAGKAPYAHYISSGISEGRSPHRLVDWQWYSAITGRKKQSLVDFMSNRWRDGVFPHPHARVGWAYLTEAELEELFECNLNSVVGVKQTEPPEEYRLMEEPIFEALHSIATTFPHLHADALSKELHAGYESSSSAGGVLVSVVLPTKNRLSKLKRAVESVLCQTHKNIELLVVDDGGDDGSAKWVGDLDDPRIVLIESGPRGVSAARNLGLNHASGDFIAFLDSDNVMLPNFIASMVAFCVRESVDFSYAGLRLYNDSGDVRYRFKQYDKDTYWKTNYIDMNVIFHDRRKFSGVRFDETLRRCVDWDYILKLCRLQSPVGVPILGCDYYHDGAGIDRITLSGPVWDCFRVNQAHRPQVVKSERECDDIFVLPITKENFELTYRLLSKQLDLLPTRTKVQCVFLASIPKGRRAALWSLLRSSGHFDPLLSHMPLDYGAMVDFGLNMCPGRAGGWHVVRVRETTSLLGLHVIAREAASTIISPVCDSDGLYLALQYNASIGQWEQSKTNCTEVNISSVPLEFDLINLKSDCIRNLDLRFGGSFALPLLVLDAQKSGDWGIVLGTGDGQGGSDCSGYRVGLDLLNKTKFYVPQNCEYKKSNLVNQLVEYVVNDSVLSSIYVRTQRKSGPDFAIFTPAPKRNSGWGDEYYAESLADAMREAGVATDVVYRSNWLDSRDDYGSVLHIRGIAKAHLKPGSRNLMWIISHPDAVQDDEVSACEHVFTASALHTKELSAEHGGKIEFLPQCTAFEPSADLKDLSDGALEKYAVFVGDSKNVLRHPINELISDWERLFLIGPNWRDVDCMGRRHVAGGIKNSDLPAIYRAFGAVINQHWPDMAARGFVSNRLYDVAASGGYYITDDCQGIDDDLLEFGSVWRGGSIEEIFSARPRFSTSEIYDRARQFYEENSFKARAASIKRLLT